MRVIDADFLLKGVDENISVLRIEAGNDPVLNRAVNLVQLTRDFIAIQPTIDAVPVVRCKDCKHGSLFCKGKQLIECTLDDYELVNSDDFCSYGERKENTDD